MNPDLRIAQIISVLEKEDALLKGVSARFFNQEKLDAEWLENALNTPDGIDRLESFAAKFSRMQDMLIDKLLPLFLQHLGEIPKTAIDNLNRLEQLNIIDDANSWADMRQLRNKLVHEYVDDNQQLCEYLLLAKKFSANLSAGFVNLKSALQV
ncbi:MAG: hypothetical protein HAW58_00490 [Candidatus Thioglobus sp.]|nr:hypothetical protein [Candidatus Thioglobus sp.]